MHLAIENQIRNQDRDQPIFSKPKPKLADPDPSMEPLIPLKSQPKTQTQKVKEYANLALPAIPRLLAFLSDFVDRDGRAGWGSGVMRNLLNALSRISLKVRGGEVAMPSTFCSAASERRVRGMGVQAGCGRRLLFECRKMVRLRSWDREYLLEIVIYNMIPHTHCLKYHWIILNLHLLI